jgi:hypothetical protein
MKQSALRLLKVKSRLSGGHHSGAADDLSILGYDASFSGEWL